MVVDVNSDVLTPEGRGDWRCGLACWRFDDSRWMILLRCSYC